MLRRLFSFAVGAVRDPVSKDLSSVRVLALLFGIAGVVIALTHPTNSAEVVVGLVGGGAVAMLTRTKSTD